MSVRFGEMDETLPASWTEEKQVKDIAIGYKKIKNNVYGFEANEEFSDKLVLIPFPLDFGNFMVTKKYIYPNSDISMTHSVMHIIWKQ
jgi:hypothetical protein